MCVLPRVCVTYFRWYPFLVHVLGYHTYRVSHTHAITLGIIHIPAISHIHTQKHSILKLNPITSAPTHSCKISNYRIFQLFFFVYISQKKERTLCHTTIIHFISNNLPSPSHPSFVRKWTTLHLLTQRHVLDIGRRIVEILSGNWDIHSKVLDWDKH